MNWLIFIFAIEAGFLPRVDLGIVGEPVFYVQMESRVYIAEIFYIGGSMKTFIFPTDHYTFDPFSSLYLFETGFEKGMVKIGFRHYCQHPDRIIYPQYGPLWKGGYEEIYLRIEGEIGG